MATKRNRRWTREETIIVFNLYCRIPFKDSQASHPEVRRFAAMVDRTPASVHMKIGNLGALDPDLKNRGISGLRNTSLLDRTVWDEFHNDWQSLIDESDKLIAERERGLFVQPEDGDGLKREGADKAVVRKVRENQSFFRAAILSAYESRCCVTGIDIEALLVASHIKPWAVSDNSEKLNPRNGLCLNALHDRAFDRGLMGVADDFAIMVSGQAAHSTNAAVRSLLLKYAGLRIRLPSRFLPSTDFLAWHRDNVFIE